MNVLVMVGLGVGGFVVGALVSSLATRRLRDRLTRLGVRLRVAVLPLLEEHAHQLGIGRDVPDEGDDPVVRVLALADRIKNHKEQEKLPYSDTLEVSSSEVAAELDRASKRGA